jgi:hypothetical protein
MKNSILNKQTRNKIYKLALKFYTSVEPYTIMGLCASLCAAVEGLNIIIPRTDCGYSRIYKELGRIHPNEGFYLFSEIMKFQPARFSTYWFPIMDQQPRIDILNSAINESNRKSKKIKNE